MRGASVRVIACVVALLALAAGFLSGSGPKTVTNAAATVPGSAVTLEYPSRWTKASPPAALAALRLHRIVVLTPRAHDATEGLLAASAPGQDEPLPGALVEKLHDPPKAEAVWLVSVPAYRYPDLSIAGSDLRFTAYAIPGLNERFGVVLCFAESAQSATRRRCEQLVESSQSSGAQATSSELTPQPDYARQLSIALRGLDKVRGETRRLMAGRLSAASMAADAARLAKAFADTGRALETVIHPSVAAHASAALQSSVLVGQHAYEALASAAEAGEQPVFVAARQRVDEAEESMRAALAAFDLLGYRIDD